MKRVCECEWEECEWEWKGARLMLLVNVLMKIDVGRKIRGWEGEWGAG